jgi:putative transposase
LISTKRIDGRVGYPKTLRVDQGSEFISRNLDVCLCEGRHLGLLAPRQTDGQRDRRGVQQPRAGRLHDAHRFLTLADAREKLEAWRNYYNKERPHGAIDNRPPISLQNPAGLASPPS